MLSLVILSSVAALILLIILIVRLKKQHEQKREIIAKAQDKMREEALDSVILNTRAPIGDLRAASEKPFSVDYGVGTAQSGASTSGRMLQIEERSELSSRKYMLDPSYPITVGAARENTIVLSGAGVAERQCELGQTGARLYLTNLAEEIPVYLSRRKKQIGVDKRRLEIRDGDSIRLGNVTLRITVVKTDEKGGRKRA